MARAREDVGRWLGRRVGMLVVMRAVTNESGPTCVVCKCVCGRTWTGPLIRLKRGNTRSCGCGKRKGGRGLDLKGRRFGLLTVTKQASSVREGGGRTGGRSVRMWECACDCGATSMVRAGGLLSGNTTSCGCRKRDASARHANRLRQGTVFGSLTVVRHLGGKFYLVQSACSRQFRVRRGDLMSGKTFRCRCGGVGCVPVDGDLMAPAEIAKKYGLSASCVRERIRRGLTGSELTARPSNHPNTVHLHGVDMTFAEMAQILGLSSGNVIRLRLKSGWPLEAAISANPQTVAEWRRKGRLRGLRAHPRGFVLKQRHIQSRDA